MMKAKIIMVFVVVTTLMSCNTNNKTTDESEIHQEDHSTDVVVLNESQRNALNLKLDTFQLRNLTTVVKSNGQLAVPPTSSAEVTAVIGGNVKEIKVFHGDNVRKGQLLAVLEHPDYIKLQEDFATVSNQMEFLKKEYERQKELFENNVGAGREYQKIQSEYNSAKAKYHGLQSRLRLLHLSPEKVQEGKISNTVAIVAPINGFVNKINIKMGTYAGAQDILFRITDNSKIHADFMVYEKDVHLIKEGQKIHFTVSNRPGEELTATIFAIGKEFEANSRAVHVHAKINEKVSGLIPGMYITGNLDTDEKYTRTLPNDAIVAEGTKSYIFILDHKDNDDAAEKKMAFRMTEVIPGLKDDGYTEVQLINPLPEDTQVVMNAAYYLLADIKKEETEHEH